MMRVTLIRHGSVVKEYAHCYNGHIDIGLSPEGRAEAHALAKRFATEQFDRIYCSDLKRARETLAPFAQVQDAHYTSKLREKSWGKHEGLSFEAICATGVVYEDFKQWLDALDGEKFQSFCKRVAEFFFKELPATGAKSVLVVTHAGVIRTLIMLQEQISLEEAFARKLPYGSAVEIEL